MGICFEGAQPSVRCRMVPPIIRNVIIIFLSLGCCQSLNILSTSRIVDLRSDTVTRPSAEMRRAMFEAEVGDDVFGDDPTVHMLENKLATMFGKEGALFFPSGTMSNLAATMSWCGKRGSEMILGDSSHMFLYEQGGVSQLAGVLPRTITNNRDGTIDLDSVEKAVRQNNIHFPVTELIAIEDTHNFCGGRVLPKGYLDSLSTIAKARDIAVHLDGARIWNAATATTSKLNEISRGADSISVCLSKGLGAPSGSILLGPRDFIEKARRCRKVLGGGMRQVGILAAAGLQAVADYEAGILLPDHNKATLLANAIACIPGFSVAVETVETNIILVGVSGDASKPAIAAALLKERGVLVLPFGVNSVRLVTHRDIVDDDIDIVIAAFKDISMNMWPPERLNTTAIHISSEELEKDGEQAYEDLSPPIAVKIEQEPVRKSISTRRLITKVLQNQDIFRSDLTLHEKKDIVDSAQGITVSPGDVVIRMGDSAEFFYIIESGRVDFYLDGSGQYSNPVKTLTTGGFFGEIALMYDAPRAATVISATETTLWRIHKNDFFTIQKEPDNKLGFFKVRDYVPEEDIVFYEEGTDEIVPVDDGPFEKTIDTREESSDRLCIAQAQAEALRTAPEISNVIAIENVERNSEGDDDLFVIGDVESFETWEEEELQGLESGGQAVSLTEDEEEQGKLELSSESITDESNDDPNEYYEETVIHGMSLSDDGFCVLLKGVVCDRVLRVLVTPSDPMSDGLDIDQVETSEAVTLLQLLQGIDVESVLARDALAVKFAESGPGKQQYILQRVMVDGVSTSKTFHARLLGSALSSGAAQAAAISSSQIVNSLPVSVVPQHNFDHPVYETLPHSSNLPDPIHDPVTYEVDTYPPEQTLQAPLKTNTQSGSQAVDANFLDIPQERNLLMDGRSIEREVELNCAFEAIALALRHSAVVEVRSSLLQDEHCSYSLEELSSFFPKLVESGISSDEHGRFGADYDSKSEMERLQRRLFEAIRQGNSAKTDSIKRQLEFYSHIEGRSVLVLPPPPLFLAPDIVPTQSDVQILPQYLPDSVVDMQLSETPANLSLLPDIPFSPTAGPSLQTVEMLELEPSSLFQAFSLPFQFDAQKLEQMELEEGKLDEESQCITGIEGEEGNCNDDSDDGLGRHLRLLYLEDEQLDNSKWQ